MGGRGEGIWGQEEGRFGGGGRDVCNICTLVKIHTVLSMMLSPMTIELGGRGGGR